MDPSTRVFGDFAGHGLVVRIQESVDFYPTGKTVGVYPSERKRELRDRMAGAGAAADRHPGRGGRTDHGRRTAARRVLAAASEMRWVTDEAAGDEGSLTRL